jgi:hypothetical protein
MICCTNYLQAVAYELNAAFSTVLAQRMTYFNSDPGADVIDRVRGEISQVRYKVELEVLKGPGLRAFVLLAAAAAAAHDVHQQRSRG